MALTAPLREHPKNTLYIALPLSIVLLWSKNWLLRRADTAKANLHGPDWYFLFLHSAAVLSEQKCWVTYYNLSSEVNWKVMFWKEEVLTYQVTCAFWVRQLHGDRSAIVRFVPGNQGVAFAASAMTQLANSLSPSTGIPYRHWFVFNKTGFVTVEWDMFPEEIYHQFCRIGSLDLLWAN